MKDLVLYHEVREMNINGTKLEYVVYYVYIGNVKCYLKPKDSTSSELLKNYYFNDPDSEK